MFDALRSEVREVLERYGQRIFNVGLFAFFAVAMGADLHKVWREGRLDYVEVSFVVQNVVLLGFILLRRPHRAVNRNLLHQAVALAAFFSGVFFVGAPTTGGPAAHTASAIIVFAANLLGLATVVNLGRSFGILIALRKVETRFLYRVVRHPMYATDILLRVGFLVSHLTWQPAVLFVASTGCYVVRALLEEKFLASQDPAYAEYMQRTRWRFIPFVF
ncbi:MAG: methyltransferase [Myxococcales bacterium]